MPIIIDPHHDGATLDDARPATEPIESPSAPGGNGAAVTPSTTVEPAPRAGRRRWPYVAAGIGLVAAGAAAIVSRSDDTTTESVDDTSVEVRTVSAEVRDLVEYTNLDGRMVYADTTVVTSPADGVVTGVIIAGEIVARGTEVYEVNGTPVVAFVGDTPMYRPLAEEATGDDVEMVEANLAALGYHTLDDDEGDPTDTGFVVDGVWDDATTDAVIRWQEDLDVPATGEIATTDVVVIDGTAAVTDVMVEVGDRVSANSPIVELNVQSTIGTRHVEHFGEIDVLVSNGDTIENGDVFYTVDGTPITAIVAPDGINRELRDGVDDGEDVLALEQMLVSLGYDADGDLDVDDEFDDATTRAVTDWQADLQNLDEDLDADGRVDPSDLYVIDDGEVVGALAATDGAVLASGSELWSTERAGSTRKIETAIAVSDQDRMAIGDTVDVEFPDGEVVQGTVTEIATSSTVDPMDPDAEAMLAVELSIDTVPESASDLNELDVEVKLVDELSAGATVVPVSALVARGDGTFEVEALTTTGTTFVPVDPGMFSDGVVAVEGIAPGTQVVVP
ncbi:MAG: peptidoglycan-binding domain-containing protein [Ilumatobacteraceae bacterium]|nr:peptidoglycan-binding domain-containing protein [Ilumatobacteraceae bacterium]